MALAVLALPSAAAEMEVSDAGAAPDPDVQAEANDSGASAWAESVFFALNLADLSPETALGLGDPTSPDVALWSGVSTVGWETPILVGATQSASESTAPVSSEGASALRISGSLAVIGEPVPVASVEANEAGGEVAVSDWTRSPTPTGPQSSPHRADESPPEGGGSRFYEGTDPDAPKGDDRCACGGGDAPDDGPYQQPPHSPESEPESDAPEDSGASGSPSPLRPMTDAADRAIAGATDTVRRLVPPTPSQPAAPGVPSAPSLAVTPSLVEADGSASPMTQATGPAPRGGVSPAAAVAMATLALAGVAVPFAAAGGSAAPLFLHKMLEALRRLARWALGVPLYAKLRKDQVLGHPVRESIVGIVQAEPGIHAQALRRQLDLGWGTLAHHLRVLETWGLVALQRDGNKVKAFPAEWSPADRRRAATLANPGTSQLFQAIVDRPGSEQRLLAEAVGRSHPTVIWHAQRLEKAGLIRVERRGRRTAYFATPA